MFCMSKEFKETLYHVYVLIHVEDNRRIFYIGKTGHPNNRARKHAYSAKTGKCFPVYKEMRRIWASGGTVELEVLTGPLASEHASLIESNLILCIGLDKLSNEDSGLKARKLKLGLSRNAATTGKHFDYEQHRHLLNDRTLFGTGAIKLKK